MSVTAPQTVHRVRPLITALELRRAPMALDATHFLPDEFGDTDKEASLVDAIRRASGMVTNYCHQPLHAAQDTDAGRVPITRDGRLAINPRHWPIRQVISVAAGTDSAATNLVDLTSIEIEPWRFTVPSPWPPGAARPYARWTYVAGHPVTTLTADAAAGATTIVVDDATGIIAGFTELTLADGANTEYVVPLAVNGLTLTIPALAHDHTAGVGCSALPDDVKQAVLLLIDAGLQYCDAHSLTIARQNRSVGVEQDQRAAMLLTARELLNDYRRVR